MAHSNFSPTTLRKGTLIATLSAMSFGSAVVFIRYAFQVGVTPITAAFLRFTLAALMLVILLSASRGWSPISARRAIILIGLGVFMYTTAGVTWLTAFSLIPAWLVSLIIALHPLIVTLGSWLFLRERLRWPQLLALLTVLLGSACLFWRPFEGAAWTGIWLMLLNVVVSAAYLLIGQRWTRDLPPLTSTIWLVSGGMLGTLTYGLLFKQLSFAFAPSGWFWMVLFAAVSTVLAVSMLWWGINLIGPSRTAILGSFEPVFSIVLAVLLLGESLQPLQVAGGVLILVGMFLVQWHPGGGER
ncbi:MAG: DMT family transporter [Anaerolineae bacterium]